MEGISITTTLGSSVFLTVFLWAVFGVYTSFFHGTVSLIPWRTSHTVIFGLVWMFFVMAVSLTQARTARNVLALCGWSWNRWPMLPLAIANLFIQVNGTLLVALAWFSVSLPVTLSSLEGGVVTGLITLVAVIGVLLPCNVVMVLYTKWLVRESYAEYDRMPRQSRM